ncbi:MAG: PQQ-binding-like beta-propeller repeat protein [Sedimentisphaerales bacterium]|nr:PQQ-binding-like beta-propeller repeat protein [Sedimentisphaerales bacterium]
MMSKKPTTSRPVLHSLVCVVACLSIVGQVCADDWPNYRGPNRDGISKETGWNTTWPAEGPKVLWKASIGIGFASMAVVDGRVYAMGNRNDQDTLYCFNAETGDEIWKKSYACPLYDKMHEGGPCSTPTVNGDAVYTFSKNGDAIRFDAATGTIVWHKNLVEELGVKNLIWYFAGSVVPVGDLVIFSAGPSGTALRKSDGSVAWTSGTEVAGYATAVPATIDGQKCLVLVGAYEVFGVDPADGKVLWRYPWEGYQEINAADAVVIDGSTVFVSTGYNRGCTLLKIADGKVTEAWKNREMSTQLNPAVFWNGYLYGFNGMIGMRGPGKGMLTCLDPKTGDEKWAQPGLGTGSAMLADGKLIVLGEAGKLAIVEASPDGYKELASAQILSGRCWTVPVLANGRIYARNAAGDLVCVDVRNQN